MTTDTVTNAEHSAAAASPMPAAPTGRMPEPPAGRWQQADSVHRPTTDRAVKFWLYALAWLVFVMVIIGGGTRLTDSGLSITEWQPIMGIIPPLSHADWQLAFDKYREIPEYQLINKGMSLEAFQYIYWWEWGHRFFGRMIGIAFLLPFVFFLATRRIGGSLALKLLGIFALGGLQAFAGWYMVKSGLVERVDVSQYRLAIHLGLAALIFSGLVWVVLTLEHAASTGHGAPISRALRWSAGGLLALIFLQIIAGAFVAGTDAGLSHNTWPLMDGKFVPDGLLVMQPWHANLFENVATIQFQHRILAYGVAAWAAFHALAAGGHDGIRGTARLLLAGVVAQIGAGIWTLLAQVPLWLGLLHQGGAFFVLALALMHVANIHRTSRP